MEAPGSSHAARGTGATESVAAGSIAASLEFPATSISIAANLISNINARSEASHSRVSRLAVEYIGIEENGISEGIVKVRRALGSVDGEWWLRLDAASLA
jgi:hypothetical protein